MLQHYDKQWLAQEFEQEKQIKFLLGPYTKGGRRGRQVLF